MGFWTGDYGRADQYVNGAAAQNGHYSVDTHVARQCQDSDNKNQRKDRVTSAVHDAVQKTSGLLDWLSK
jgi:hypothetical protein